MVAIALIWFIFGGFIGAMLTAFFIATNGDENLNEHIMELRDARYQMNRQRTKYKMTKFVKSLFRDQKIGMNPALIEQQTKILHEMREILEDLYLKGDKKYEQE